MHVHLYVLCVPLYQKLRNRVLVIPNGSLIHTHTHSHTHTHTHIHLLTFHRFSFLTVSPVDEWSRPNVSKVRRLYNDVYIYIYLFIFIYITFIRRKRARYDIGVVTAVDTTSSITTAVDTTSSIITSVDTTSSVTTVITSSGFTSNMDFCK